MDIAARNGVWLGSEQKKDTGTAPDRPMPRFFGPIVRSNNSTLQFWARDKVIAVNLSV